MCDLSCEESGHARLDGAEGWIEVMGKRKWPVDSETCMGEKFIRPPIFIKRISNDVR